MKSPLRLVLSSIILCSVIVWSSFACFSVILLVLRIAHHLIIGLVFYQCHTMITVLSCNALKLYCLLKFNALPLYVKLLYFL